MDLPALYCQGQQVNVRYPLSTVDAQVINDRLIKSDSLVLRRKAA
jgi:hypothetical protein